MLDSEAWDLPFGAKYRLGFGLAQNSKPVHPENVQVIDKKLRFE